MFVVDPPCTYPQVDPRGFRDSKASERVLAVACPHHQLPRGQHVLDSSLRLGFHFLQQWLLVDKEKLYKFTKI